MYTLGVRADDVAALVAERERGGPFSSLEELASRAGAGRPALEQLAWSGACDAFAGGDRRRALWGLGVAAPGRPVPHAAGTQLALPLDTGGSRRLRRWAAGTRWSPTTRPPASRRPRTRWRTPAPSWPGAAAIASGGFAQTQHGAPVASPGSSLPASGRRPPRACASCCWRMSRAQSTSWFHRPVYARFRAIVRTEPLILATGVLERQPAAGGGVNVVCRSLERLTITPGATAAPVTELPVTGEAVASVAVASIAGDFRAVAGGAELRGGASAVGWFSDRADRTGRRGGGGAVGGVRPDAAMERHPVVTTSALCAVQHLYCARRPGGWSSRCHGDGRPQRASRLGVLPGGNARSTPPGVRATSHGGSRRVASRARGAEAQSYGPRRQRRGAGVLHRARLRRRRRGRPRAAA